MDVDPTVLEKDPGIHAVQALVPEGEQHQIVQGSAITRHLTVKKNFVLTRTEQISRDNEEKRLSSIYVIITIAWIMGLNMPEEIANVPAVQREHVEEPELDAGP